LRPPLVLVLVLVLVLGCGEESATPPAPDAGPPPKGGLDDALRGLGTAARSPGASMTGREAPTAAEKRPLLVFANQTLGWLEPCGCSEGMLGGLARRAALLTALKARGFEVTLYEGGDLIDRPGRQAELKLETLYQILAGLVRRGLVQRIRLGFGERDVALRHVPGPDGVFVGERLRNVDEVGGLGDCLPDWSMSSFVSPSFALEFEAASGGKLSVKDPAPILARIPEDARRTVVLFHGSRDEARGLFANRRDTLVVLAGHDEELPHEPERLPGGALLLSVGDKGKYVGLVEVTDVAKEAGYRLAESRGIVPLDDRVPDDPEVLAMIDRYKQRLVEENLVALEARKLPESGGSFLGPADCKSCHPGQYKVWEKSKHSHAYENLKPRRGQGDPECLRCHTTGFGFTSGFAGEEKTPHLAFVSCESCHGVGSNHAVNPQLGFGRVAEPRKLCIRCHDKENSPEFDPATYVPPIQCPPIDRNSPPIAAMLRSGFQAAVDGARPDLVRDFAFWSRLATKAMLARDLDWILRLTQATVDVAPGSFEARYNLGRALLDHGRGPEAIEAFVAAGRVDPTNPGADRACAWAYLLGDGGLAPDAEKAVEHSKRAVEIGGLTDGKSRAVLALALEARGDLEAAKETAEQAVRLDPSVEPQVSQLLAR
jgi:hypothetical protein